MIDVHFCNDGDVYVFGRNNLIWSPYGDLHRFGAQEKTSARFPSFDHAIKFVEVQPAHPERVKSIYLGNLEDAKIIAGQGEIRA